MYEITFKLENSTVITKECRDKVAFYTMLSLLIIPAFNQHILWIQGWKKDESDNYTIIYEYDKYENICELYNDD